MPPIPSKQTAQVNNRVVQQPKPSGGVFDRIKPIGFDDEDGIKILLYGVSGTGKTTLYSTFPAPILSIVCSGGDRPGELKSVDTPENRKRISQVVLQKGDEVLEICQGLKEGYYKTVVIDHLTGLQDLVLKEVLNLTEIPQQKGWAFCTRQDWGLCVSKCKDLLVKTLKLRANVVWVAHEKTFTPDEEGDSDIIKPFVGAALAPSLCGWVNGAVEYICQTYIRQKTQTTSMTIGKGKSAVTEEVTQNVRGVDYVLRTEAHASYASKFRLPRGRKLENIVDPSYDKIRAMISGESL